MPRTKPKSPDVPEQPPFAPPSPAELAAVATPSSGISGIEELAAKGTRRRFARFTVLIQEGEIDSTLYIVLSGKLRVYVSDDKGKEVTLSVVGPGDYVGEMSLDGGPRSACVDTLEKTVCSVVQRDTLREHIAQNPDFAFHMMSRLIRRARLATESVRSLALIDTYGRLVQVLDHLAVPHPDEEGRRIISQKITHQDLANQVVCSREMVSRILKELERGGYLATQGRRLVITQDLPSRW